MRTFFFLIFLSVFFTNSQAQSDSLKTKRKNKFYLTWGYTRAIYSKSNIHFKDLSNKYHDATGRNNYYEFTLYNVTASDRPEFEKIKDLVNVTIPQFVVHSGYQFNDKWGIEINYDHTKYVVDDYQKVRVKGQFNGVAVDGDSILNPKTFIHFEHTDGANFWMLNAVRKFKLYQAKKNFCASWVAKAGGGVVFPRTDVTLFGERLNNNWKVAGWIVGAETGLRLEFLKYGIFEFVSKGVYADYVNAFVFGKGNGKANHHFFAGQLTATIGFTF
jgi:hypothetical protein